MNADFMATANGFVVKGLLSPALSAKGTEGEPLAHCSPPPEAGTVPASPPLPEAWSRRQTRPAHQILLVEDDGIIRETSAAVLVRAGYQVNAVEGSQAAWDALQSRSYDLVITDTQMPGLSGFELVRKLRSVPSVLPVIMASGGIGAEELTRAEWLQPARVLPKPFTSDALLAMVTEVLNWAGLALALASIPVAVSYEPYDHWGINE